MRKKIEQAKKDIKALFNYATQGGDYGVKQNLKVSDKVRLQQMKLSQESPLNKIKKSFKVLYKHYSDLF